LRDAPVSRQPRGKTGYPLAEDIPPEVLQAQLESLERSSSLPLPLRLPVYIRLGGPGFIGAALTLGAGTMTAAMLAGAQFGYRTLWVYWIAAGSGLFMLAAMARFTCRGQFRLLQIQRERHGWLMSRVLTGLVGVLLVALVFNFGQVALGTHLLEQTAMLAGVDLPRSVNWPLYVLLTSWLALNYGRGRGRGTALVERFMKYCLALMIVCFAACLVVVGVDWPAAARGLFVPWLPSGVAGMDLFIASTAAAIGVADWILFHYAGHAKGWSRRHETLARVDIVAGFGVPFVVVNFLVVAVFAGTLYQSGSVPSTAIELSRALVPLLGETGAQYAFLIGFLAVPVTSTVGLCLISALAVHEIFDWDPDVRTWRWKLALLAPQIGFLAAWYASPVTLIVILAAFLSLTNNVVGWSFYLLLNDRTVMGEDRSKSWLWNAGILVQVTLLNCVAISYVFNRLGLWGS
jgi:manganese transport protein